MRMKRYRVTMTSPQRLWAFQAPAAVLSSLQWQQTNTCPHWEEHFQTRRDNVTMEKESPRLQRLWSLVTQLMLSRVISKVSSLCAGKTVWFSHLLSAEHVCDPGVTIKSLQRHKFKEFLKSGLLLVSWHLSHTQHSHNMSPLSWQHNTLNTLCVSGVSHRLIAVLLFRNATVSRTGDTN